MKKTLWKAAYAREVRDRGAGQAPGEMAGRAEPPEVPGQHVPRLESPLPRMGSPDPVHQTAHPAELRSPCPLNGKAKHTVPAGRPPKAVPKLGEGYRQWACFLRHKLHQLSCAHRSPWDLVKMPGAGAGPESLHF